MNVQRDSSLFPPEIQANILPMLTPKREVYRSIIKRMLKLSKLPLLLGVANLICCVTSTSTEDYFAILFRGILDNSSESTIIEPDWED